MSYTSDTQQSAVKQEHADFKKTRIYTDLTKQSYLIKVQVWLWIFLSRGLGQLLRDTETRPEAISGQNEVKLCVVPITEVLSSVKGKCDGVRI